MMEGIAEGPAEARKVLGSRKVILLIKVGRWWWTDSLGWCTLNGSCYMGLYQGPYILHPSSLGSFSDILPQNTSPDEDQSYIPELVLAG